MERTRTMTRLLVIGAIALGLTISFVGSAAAQRETRVVTGADHVRALVLKHRAEVLARIEIILADKRNAAEPLEAAATNEADVAVEAEAAEPESGAEEADAADGEMEEIGEPEGGEEDAAESEEEDVLELPETGSGIQHAPMSAAAALMATIGALAALGLRTRGISRRNLPRTG